MASITPRRIAGYLMGYVRVHIRGKQPERLVNLCLSKGFPIWDISTSQGEIYFSTPPSHYKTIRPLARKARCVPKITRRTGVPFVIAKIKRRPAFVLASILILSFLYYLSGAVWTIKVAGNSEVAEELIRRIAGEEGLRIGVRKNNIACEDIESGLRLSIPELSWTYVHFHGTMAVIEVVEKVRPESQGPGDLAAKKPGVVESVLVLSGIPLVEPGQTVRQGEILIAGNPQSVLQGARGQVTAKTWYHFNFDLQLTEQVAIRTGRRQETYRLRFGEKDIGLWGTSCSFEWYEIEDYPEWQLRKPGGEEIMEVLTRVYFEVQWFQKELTIDEAKNLADVKGRQRLERQLPSSAKVIDYRCEIVGADEGLITFKITAMAIEEIGNVIPWPDRTEAD